eukprot:CAMPEP_0202458288 /NCGR_PEP_ID=MMETSP1360-20130828/23975_1 /ASSEMBLY_ACC=CAM_ASM_000848 /TAXON_ID=515479 /ORGANISM="Licmophora paradoxa, Strain CCMP2313" /LENGTH=173 /DNA_ID=CAMNT_0049078759 /DNA_START=39 /DNA_END=560 /DNA_ORIENTATION=+
MKIVSVLLTAASAAAFTPSAFVRTTTSLNAEYDLDYGKNNGYVPADVGDGGQGQFGAQSPNNWRVPGTSPVGSVSYAGAADGGDEPWFAEAVSTVSLDLAKADETLKAFTKEAAAFKIEAFSETSPYEFSTKEAAYDELVGALGYDKFLESSAKQLATAWKKLHPAPEEEKKE